MVLEEIEDSEFFELEGCEREVLSVVGGGLVFDYIEDDFLEQIYAGAPESPEVDEEVDGRELAVLGLEVPVEVVLEEALEDVLLGVFDFLGLFDDLLPLLLDALELEFGFSLLLLDDFLLAPLILLVFIAVGALLVEKLLEEGALLEEFLGAFCLELVLEILFEREFLVDLILVAVAESLVVLVVRVALVVGEIVLLVLVIEAEGALEVARLLLGPLGARAPSAAAVGSELLVREELVDLAQVVLGGVLFAGVLRIPGAVLRGVVRGVLLD